MISWDWINGQLHQQEVQKEYPEVDPQLAMLFEELVENAQFYQGSVHETEKIVR